MKVLTQAELDQIREYIQDAITNGSKLHGMSYEQGIEAMLDVIEGDVSIEELLE